ncbi:MAG: nitrogen fixation protein NifZ [Candidatus Dactylopiibacterium sp.]|nr:nitrogen fixation protein NifZ [Candidatus Dactylopiibacterium sp.]
MKPRWQTGDTLRTTRALRDDGTFPGAARGELLVRRGSLGTVVDVGSFLGDQVIYALHFIASDRVVGCREEELIGADEAWNDTAFEARDRVRSLADLTVGGTLRVPAGAAGEILKVLRDAPGGPLYHVHFDCWAGHPLVVREGALGASEVSHV